jgi:hypothetical protein
MRFILIFLLFVSVTALSQTDNIKFGIGVQAFEPSGINLQLFRGFYNNNNSSFATYGIVELGVGKENMLGIIDDDRKVYEGGYWTNGGLRVDLNYLYPLMTVHSPFVLQTYVGAGLQTGTRNYTVSGKEESQFATGMNLLLRLEYVTHGIDLGRAVWFFSIYGEVKYHADFTEKFDYISPGAGIRLRKGR